MMKKLACALLTGALALALTACGSSSSSGISGGPDSAPASSRSLPGAASQEEQAESSAAAQQGDTITAEDGYAEGRMGDVMQTYFFTYSVNSAYVCDTYEGYAPADGNELLVAEVTIKNTSRSSIEMYDTDFQAQWGATDEDAFSLPITFDAETGEDRGTVSDSQLPGTYTLGIDEARTGLLVFEVPAGSRDLSISHMEYFSDDTTGDTFFVFFTASEPASV